MSTRKKAIPEIKLRIFNSMVERGFSIRDISRSLNVSTRAVYKWLDCNSDTLPTIENFILLSELLRFDIDEILNTKLLTLKEYNYD